MLAKFLITILVLANPLFFLFGQPLPFLPQPSTHLSEDNYSLGINEWNDLEKWGKNLISNLFSANPNFLPIRDWNIVEPNIEAKAAIISTVTAREPFEKEKILYQNNIDQILPIASLTKIMTALIVLEKMNLEEIITISPEAIAGYGNKGGLVVNEKITVKDLLYLLLMESSNDAALALVEAYQNFFPGRESFVELMNQKAEDLGLSKTYFVEASGYQPNNASTAREIIQLIKYSFSQPTLWEILRTPTITISSADGKINHYLVNTDELLNRLPNIIGGKTGYTEEAQGCLVLVISQSSSERLITVVLGAQERFLETERLINWANQAYRW